MKNFKIKFLKISIITCVLALGLLVACGSDDDKNTVSAKLSIINASPTTEAYFFKINGTNFSDNALQYSKSLPYKDLLATNYQLSINRDGSTQIITQSNIDLKSGQAYSVYLSDVSPQLSLVLLRDDLTATAGKARIRFVNMSPGTRKIDLAISGHTDKIVTSTAFKGFSPFINIEPAHEITFELRDSQTDSLLASLPSGALESQKFYTLWAKDDIITSPGTKKIALGMIVNK
jgi:hypothetical protein